MISMNAWCGHICMCSLTVILGLAFICDAHQHDSDQQLYGKEVSHFPPMVILDHASDLNCSCHLLAACNAQDFTMADRSVDPWNCSCSALDDCQASLTSILYPPSACVTAVSEQYDTGLHIAAVFVILISSAMGTVIPLLVKYHPGYSVDPFYIMLGKCLGIGIVLACALVHMLQPASQSLVSACLPAEFNSDYQSYAFLFAMIAALLMHLLEIVVERHVDGKSHHHHHHASKPVDPVLNGASKIELGEICAVPTSNSAIVDVEPKREKTGFLVSSHAHSLLTTRYTISAILLEFGITVHSIFIGLQNGIVGASELKTLMVALSFHQFFEGIALGSRLADVEFSHMTEFVFTLLFSIAAPLGIAIGIILTSTLNPQGETYLLTEGTMDAVCGGILLYIGFMLLLRDFPEDIKRHCEGQKNGRLRTVAMFMSLWIGAGVMAFIGKYL